MPTLGLLLSFLLASPLLAAASNKPAHQVCLRLMGVVQDFNTHQPLAAKLLVRSTSGPAQISNSADGTGQFAVDLNCTATVLLIERTGYRPQRLPLNLSSFTPTSEVYVVIPLVATDQQGVDRPYLQTEQTHYVQPRSNGVTGQVQRSDFVITDALAKTPLRAQVCFVFTKTGQRTCLDTDASGICSVDFNDKDIVAMEVRSPGYQPYQGNISIEQMGGPTLHHTVRLLRELVLLSVQSTPTQSAAGLQGMLLREGSKTPVILASVANKPGLFTTSDLLPNRYELLLLNKQKTILHRQQITVSAGLNVETITLPTAASRPPQSLVAQATYPTATTGSPAGPLLTDDLPMLFFEEGKTSLSAEACAALAQVGRYLQQHPDVSLRLVGHTDRLGDERLNKYLGEYRAKVAANHLHWVWGIPDDRLEIIGFGSRFLIGANSTAESRRQNRRVSMKLLASRPIPGATSVTTN